MRAYTRADLPAALTHSVVVALGGYGWAAETGTNQIVVPLDDRARGLPEQVAKGEDLYVLWTGPHPEWHWGTAHPFAPAGGRTAQLLAYPAGDPATVTAQILRVLRTGRALP
ncbi:MULTISPECIES: hypothetical protein [unclassified Streptomyces]|uniref:hypothetical protein n=1 Tax=unclassified Streptomyces TaxID=2593676 RepID=UPI00093B3F1A|nr:hypothetical protein [Streptomyces sp. TSRI0281]OKI34979.1 hypothetical protein A6A29_16265 [Streptomyces sp. TSRI0281]